MSFTPIKDEKRSNLSDVGGRDVVGASELRPPFTKKFTHFSSRIWGLKKKTLLHKSHSEPDEIAAVARHHILLW